MMTLRAGWLALSVVGFGVLLFLLANTDLRGADARSYWRFDLSHPYVEGTGNLSAPIAFRYAPPLALVMAPFGALSWPAFLWLWTGIALAALAWVTGRWTFAAIAFYPVALELSVLNIHLLLAAALVAGLRWPWAWAFLPLTKVTPGVCWLWLVVRREWRSFGIAVATTIALSVASVIIAPDLWNQWVAMLASEIGAPAGISVPIPLAVRLPVAAVIVVWGARFDRPWTLAVALLLSLPTIWPQGFAVLIAAPFLGRSATLFRPGSQSAGKLGDAT
jgi:hypothetical protein